MVSWMNGEEDSKGSKAKAKARIPNDGGAECVIDLGIARDETAAAMPDTDTVGKDTFNDTDAGAHAHAGRSGRSSRSSIPLFDTDADTDADAPRRSISLLLSRYMARHAWKTIIFSLIITTVISAVGLIVGEFSISVDNDGWRSRRTKISKRGIQLSVLANFQQELFWKATEDGGNQGLWEKLQKERLSSFNWDWIDEEGNIASGDDRRQLEDEVCDSWHGSDKMRDGDNLVFVWQTSPGESESSDSALSALDPQVLREICDAEMNTLSLLEAKNLCIPCADAKCLDPHSLVRMLKLFLHIQSGQDASTATTSDISCEEMIQQYTPAVQSLFTSSLATCVEDIKAAINIITGKLESNVTSCLPGFDTNLVSKDFGTNETSLRYTSSIFHTDGFSKEIFPLKGDFDTGDEVLVSGSYNTLNSYFTDTEVDGALAVDMFIGSGSLLVTALAMVIHTKSIWLAFMGILQIIYSVPLAYFVYHFIAGLRFFPVLNFMGVFVVAALGADDVFVAVDKWKNARIKYPDATTEEIAMVAFPNAASAMLLTTSTTAIAFFATALCPVAPIRCFAVYCGLLIVFDYFMDVLIMFPALAIYDRWIMSGKSGCLVTFQNKSRDASKPSTANSGSGTSNETDTKVEDPTTKLNEKRSLIHRILLFYYKIQHKFQWVFVCLCIFAIAMCAYIASTFKLPEESDVQLLPDDNKVRKFNRWFPNEILSNTLQLSGSRVSIVWGLHPSDDGNINDPTSVPRLTVGEFEPSSIESQEYLLNFCDKLYANDFAALPSDGYVCPMNAFNDWLEEQSISSSPDEAYTLSCNNATSVPVPEDLFHECILSWAYSPMVADTLNYQILPEGGKVKVMRVTAVTDVSWINTYEEIGSRWKDYEAFMKEENKIAPEGVKDEMYHSSGTFWWYDTNGVMWKAAIYSAAIAIAFSALVVLFSSKSFVLSMVSSLSIIYVLGATIASLVGMGWSLGFVESICIAILVGISCDFVIHFSHAYSFMSGSRHIRTQYALIHMGPSVLAAAATTISAAIIMFFCTIVFFTKFALILFLTILHSTLGTFVVFVTFVDTIGPNETGTCYKKLKSLLPC